MRDLISGISSNLSFDGWETIIGGPEALELFLLNP
jgi:hypothetical protein